ncbi:response regulator receiver protein [Magnetococcus marinus MC-1]|uniref:Response regulator receiver protein n=1 Tax=Magnetococcus marinus (strain ATCC BAA-1437 / JCM 17883 / MC-1) TaxID=156889 RepID=A0LBV4_MAGMM|nr:fused response regulator/phosphatase [Magnetococcus marinus]ABK45447.1 response regulator receiver protein [Magnetococcus marinus MC-1]
MAKILVVDDDPMSLMHLEYFLAQQGHEVVTAADGHQGVAAFEQIQPQLVLMDVMMPNMDGYTATGHIKSSSADRNQVPVLFLTGIADQTMLAHCLACGGDDFITKPFDNIILKARIDAWLRRIELDNRVKADRLKVEGVLLRMREDDRFDGRNLRYLMTPLEKTNGDIILSARTPDGTQHTMVGDFTGHGLPAAIAGPLLSEIFYHDVAEGAPGQHILTHINQTLQKKLPTAMFLCATYLTIGPDRNSVQLWNCGMPDLLIFDPDLTVHRLTSTHMPLGIMPQPFNQDSGRIHPLQPSQRLVVYSDGIVETLNQHFEMYGVERLIAQWVQIHQQHGDLTEILTDLNRFRGTQQQTDDITLMELTP